MGISPTIAKTRKARKQTMSNKTIFTGRSGDHETRMGFQVNLGETPNLSNLDQLFEDLFLQWRVDPQYLFVSKDDIDTLRDEVLQGYTNPYLTRLAITKITNQTTGRLVDLVPLPG